jgi:4-hydroxybenzoate polyprenyltransferase
VKRTIFGLIRLARYKEYTFFVTVTTLLGVAAAGGQFGWKFLGVWAANWLAVAFAFMINDVEDADDDALNPEKVHRNPVSAGDLNHHTATWASLGVAAASAALYLMLGFWPAILGLVSLALGYLYSWRVIRFKNMPFIDLLSHCMMLAGLQFLPGMLAFSTHEAAFDWIFPFVFIVSISLYGELFNELRDLDGDLAAGLNHTASKLGYKPTYWIMMSLLSIGVVCGGITFFVLNIIPTWVVITLLALAAIFVIRPAIKARRHRTGLAMQQSFQKPLEAAAALALLAQFVYPWLYPLLLQWVNINALLKYFSF